MPSRPLLSLPCALMLGGTRLCCVRLAYRGHPGPTQSYQVLNAQSDIQAPLSTGNVDFFKLLYFFVQPYVKPPVEQRQGRNASHL